MTTVNNTRSTIAKVLFFLCLAIMAAVCGVNAQTVIKQDANGNYYSEKIVVKDTTARKTETTATSKYYIDNKGERYPVYVSKNGKLFVIRTSKNTGKQYNQYLKL